MLEIKIEKSFKKDIKRDKKSGKHSNLDFELLKNIIKKLQEEKFIDPIFKRHSLFGPMHGYKVVHIKNDWLLVFKVQKPFLNLIMLGKHAQVYITL